MDKGTISFMSKSITQDMAYRQSLMKYAEKYNVSRASRKYNRSRQRGYTRRPESLFRVMRKLGPIGCKEKPLQTQALRANDLSRAVRWM